MRQIERNDVVPEQERRAFGELIQLAQGCREIAAGKPAGGARIATNGGERVDARVVDADFKVDAETAGIERGTLRGLRTRRAGRRPLLKHVQRSSSFF